MRRVALHVALLVLWPVSVGHCQTYSTRFDGSANPLSEGGRWSNAGLDWTNIRKDQGIACSTQSGVDTGKFKYNDSYSVLSGFPPDQEAWGDVQIKKPSSSYTQELEILLRFTSSPHWTTGYSASPGASTTIPRMWRSSGGTARWVSSRTLPGCTARATGSRMAIH